MSVAQIVSRPSPDPATRSVDDPAAVDGPRSEPALRRAVSSPVGTAVVVAGAVLAVDAGGTDDGAGLCVFRRCTGGYCPGCGLTRSARHLVHGEIGAAWHDHPWIVFAVVQIAVVAAVRGITRHRGPRIDRGLPVGVLAVANAVALVGIWAIRLTNGSIPRFF